MLEQNYRDYYDAVYRAVAREYPNGGVVFARQLKRAVSYVEDNWDLEARDGPRPDPKVVARDALVAVTKT